MWSTTRKGPKAKPVAKKGAAVVKHPKEWNNYLTDNQHILSREELLKKKKLFVSRNNPVDSGYVPPPVMPKPKRRPLPADDLSVGQEPNSLDLLALSDDEEDHEDYCRVEMVEKVVKHTPKPSKAPMKPKAAKPAPSPAPAPPKVFNKPKATITVVPRQTEPLPVPVEALPAAAEEEGEEDEELAYLLQELHSYEMGGSDFSPSALELEQLFVGMPPKGVTKLLGQLVCQMLTKLLEKDVQQGTLQAQLDELQRQYNDLRERISSKPLQVLLDSSSSLLTPQPAYRPPVPEYAASSTPVRTVPATPLLQQSTTPYGDLFRTDDLLGLEDADGSPSFVEMERLIAEGKAIGSSISPTALRTISHGHSLEERMVPVPAQVITTGPAQDAGREIWQKERELSLKAMGFSGTSATDLLFLSPSSHRVSSTAATPIVTPAGQYMYQSAGEAAGHTFDLYMQSIRQQVKEDVKPADSFEEEDAIDRLSYKLSSDLSMHHQQPPHPPVHRVEAPHPFNSTVRLQQGQFVHKTGKKVEAHFATKELFPRSPEQRRDPRVFDATCGHF